MTEGASHASAIAGVQAMDDQHAILIDTLSALRQQLSQGAGSAQLIEQLERLAEFTGLHFGCEETLLRRHGFPHLEQHRKAHKDLMSNMKQVLRRAENGEYAELKRMLGFVRGQYMEHVEGLDREYSQWLYARKGPRKVRAR